MVDDIAAEYRLGPRFLNAWQQQGGASIEDLAAMPPDSHERLWAEFSLTTNLRGQELAWQVARRLTDGVPTLAGRSSIDVGCGLGGTAVECARLGSDALGIDPDPERVDLATANGADSGASVRFLSGDLLDGHVRRQLGCFDAVIAQDVLEHVADARKGVHALAELASAGGLVAAVIPNGDAASFVLADGHYLLPGLTLLRHRPAAVEYHEARFPNGDYDVENYHSWDSYAAWFAEAGLTIVDVEHIGGVSWDELDATLGAAHLAVVEAADSLPQSVRSALKMAWSDYVDRVAAARSLPRSEAERRVTVESWRVYASRGPLRKQVHKRARTRLRKLTKRIPGMSALVKAWRGRAD
ncbi:MAG: methyltransferase domain-containing protein [Acidimicrobiia bacterium]